MKNWGLKQRRVMLLSIPFPETGYRVGDRSWSILDLF